MTNNNDSMLSLDLSWSMGFHTVTISRWSEPPGPGGFQCFSWRVLLGAYGRYVSSDDRDLQVAIKETLSKAAADPTLRLLLPASALPG